jgi:hypothetical protein
MTVQKNPLGRPLTFESPEILQKQIDAYFKECDRQEDPCVFAHAEKVLQQVPDIEKGKRVIKKWIVCSKCFPIALGAATGNRRADDAFGR